MLQVQNVTAGYGPLTVLNDVSLSLADGARLGIFGHNGAGKTTLLRCIVGAVRPSRGKVNVNGIDTAAATVAESGVAVCVVEHNISFVRDLCDEGVFMFAGAIMARGPVAELIRNPQLTELYFGH